MMKRIVLFLSEGPRIGISFILILSGLMLNAKLDGQKAEPDLHYIVSMENPVNQVFHVELKCRDCIEDTICLRMPQWMPGYYQIMNYWKEVSDFNAAGADGKPIAVNKINDNTWRLINSGNKEIRIKYNVKADKKFVANSFLDSTHGYIIPAATFMYIEGRINIPVDVTIKPYKDRDMVVTGLEKAEGKENLFRAMNFDILYDCPVLTGNLVELPSFKVRGVLHRFFAFNPGFFNQEAFISDLQKTIEAGVEIIGEIPYNQYTFIGIGPGFGGIEHLNSTTVSFSGKGLDNPEARKRNLKFLAHEYFHHYNVKRIRPFELGPFDYSRENRTNLLWVSEGLSVYYEYLMVRRAGIINDEEFLSSISDNINAYENDPGRTFQSLIQSSYNTWSDGPFGNKPGEQDKAISYYDKGPIIGLILDLAIRNASANKRSLDDVMRFLYQNYYKKLNRGFTDAEFQMVCEDMAGTSLSREFEYVSTTKEIEYNHYLKYAGLGISLVTQTNTGEKRISIYRIDERNPLQESIFDKLTGRQDASVIRQ